MGMYQLYLDSETDNKFRWNGDVHGVAFKLYVPKQIVPEPIPRRIYIAVERDLASSSNEFPHKDATGLNAIVAFVSEHTETVRYRPVGESESWIIGEPYIPKSLLPTPFPAQVGILVRWGD